MSNSLILPKIQIGKKTLATNNNNSCNCYNSCNSWNFFNWYNNCYLTIKDLLFLFSKFPKKEEIKNWIYYSTFTSDWNWIKSTKKPKFPIINKEKEDLSLPILPKIKTPSPIQTQTTFRKKRPKIPKNSN
jgi:hypothetical protein